jgi:hypothetical protein
VWVVSVFLTCVYIATKVVDHVEFNDMLLDMLRTVLGPSCVGAALCPAEAARLELEILFALDWRMSPLFEQ